MKKFDVVIIGSGLGGLECGYILSKNGYNVCILEKNTQLGGCLQTFKRGKTLFDTGFHFVGGLDEGQFLHKLFRYFDLLDLPWHRMDDDCFAEVILNNKSYAISSGFERFTETLGKEFPNQYKQTKNYADFLRQVGRNIENSFSVNQNMSLFEQSAYTFLQNTIDDTTLRNVLSGSSLTMELCKEKLPLYTFAQINSSFIQSAWRLNGDGSLIAEKLAENVRQMGGTIITKAEVTQLIEKDGKISAVEYNNEEQIEGKYIISNVHPATTLSLIPEESRCVRKSYRKRIQNLENTYGMFTVHLQLKADAVPYLNRNIFIHKENDLWDCSYHPQEQTSSVLISYQVPEQGKMHTKNIDILSPMHWENVEKWSDTTLGKRGMDYETFKQQKAEEMISIASERIPELKGNIEKQFTSSPLTYRDYTGTWNGSAYGIRKDYNDTMFTLLSPNTPVSNLLLTGQNLNLHGILGVSMTSFFTCAKIVDMESLTKDLI